MKFYQVTAKCGHVGGYDKYIPIDFFVIADTASKAAKAVKQAPRVKHHHSDAIISVTEITADQYTAGRIAFNSDPYNLCHSSQEQQRYNDVISDRIMTEETYKRSWERGFKKERSNNPKRAYRFGYNGGKMVTRGAFKYDTFDSPLSA